MAKDKEDRATRIHNKGQEDAAKDKYDPPPTSGVFSDITGTTDQLIADGESYSAGWNNAEKQK